MDAEETRQRPRLAKSIMAADLIQQFHQADETQQVLVELNIFFQGGISRAIEKFQERCDLAYGDTASAAQLRIVADSYLSFTATRSQLERLAEIDTSEGGEPRPPEQRTIYKIWRDTPLEAHLDRSVTTIKADAARRTFDATGEGVTWAVIDSGIDGNHPHFRKSSLDASSDLHCDFTGGDSPLTDGFGHGTQMAGIIAGAPPADVKISAFELANEDDVGNVTGAPIRERSIDGGFSGVAPNAQLVSLKVLDDSGRGNASRVIEALHHVRTKLNAGQKLQRVHGVNLSVGYEFDPTWFACGQSPICAEVNKLVRSGVIVVVSAGNTGFGEQTADARLTKTGLDLTINDPGNAEEAITVGSTHRDQPWTYGVSFFSSKGPTGDGRLKPDLLAPGERILCPAAGEELERILDVDAGVERSGANYLEASGTSHAAAHVSGVIAAFLSVRREFMAEPQHVKRIFLDSATDLGRDRYFQGRGLVDLMRAIQSI